MGPYWTYLARSYLRKLMVTHAHARMHARTHARTHTRTRAGRQAGRHIHTHTHTCTHTHTHTHNTHTHNTQQTYPHTTHTQRESSSARLSGDKTQRLLLHYELSPKYGHVQSNKRGPSRLINNFVNVFFFLTNEKFTPRS